MTEREIFTAALNEQDPAQRAAYLQLACGGDAALRQRVDSLLAEHGQLGSFMDMPSQVATLDQPASERPGTQIGPYKLLQQIGEGGFGVVYMAEQTEPVRRRVALKVIKPGMDTRQVIARFEAERQALAVMDHPNIAKVLDAGTTESGRPYFVMELVRGTPITQYCDENNLPVRERLELFATVCQAIQHAHTKGIIHRDIKSTNVLVTRQDGQPVVKVIDFGIAKAMGQQLTDKTLFTDFAQMIGTPLYMSPEQAELSSTDIDTRSDIYSLGVLLYELLTGSTPVSKEQLKQAAFDEIRRIIREEEPPKPSTRISTAEAAPSIAAQRHTEPAKLAKLVRGELDWIVMKALEKDRSRRYETASGFARDIEHYLNDEPVQACPPSAAYRLRKFVRRNKGPVWTVAVVLLALVGGVIGTTWGMMRAELARRLAEEERDEKDKARRVAETNEKLALKARDAERLALKSEAEQRLRAEDNAKLAMEVLDEIIMKEARRRLTLVTQDEARGFVKNPEREKLERESLAQGLTFYEKLAQTNRADWMARRQRAKAYANVGLLQLELKNYVESEKAYRQAVQLMEELAGERPRDFDNAYDLADTYHWFFRPFLDNGRLQPAEETIRHALALSEKLAVDFPDRSAKVREHKANCYRSLAGLLVNKAQPLEAEQAFLTSIAIWSELATSNPEAASYRYGLAYDRHLLAKLYTSQKRLGEADTEYQAARAGLEKLIAQFNNPEYRIRLGGVLLLWALSCKTQGRAEEGERLFRDAAVQFDALLTDSPKDNRWAIHELGYIYLYLGELLAGLGSRDEDAEKAYRQSAAYHERQLAQDPEVVNYQERVTWSYAGLIKLLRKNGRRSEALEFNAKRIELVKKVASTATVPIKINNLAWNLVTDADPDFHRAPLGVELAKKAVELAPLDGVCWNTLGTAQYRAGDWHAAILSLRKALELMQGGYFAHHAFFLAMAHWKLEEMEPARKWYAAALIWMEKHAPTNEELVRFRAEASALMGLPKELSPEQELARSDDLSFYSLVLEADPNAVWGRGARGSAYAERDQWEEAAADFARAAELNKSESLYLYREALARLQLGDVTAYRQICAAALARLDPAQKPDAARWPTWTCVLAADAVADWNEPLRLAAKGVAENPKSYRALSLHGAVLYRAGQYREAFERLMEAEQAYQPDDGKLNAVAYNWLFLAMACHRLGDVEGAKKWHDQAAQWIDQETEKKSNEPSAANSLPWNRRLTLRLLGGEAEDLLKLK